MVVLDNGYITAAFNVNTEQFYNKVTNYLLHRSCIVVIEDIAPYSLRLMPQVIDTCKWIGEAVYRLKNEAGANVELVPRSLIKKWVFDSFGEVCIPIIDKYIEKKAVLACDLVTKEEIKLFQDGREWKKRKGSFVYVNDKVVMEAMKYLYKIPLPPKGQGYKFNLKDDSWQALSLASYFWFKQLVLPSALPVYYQIPEQVASFSPSKSSNLDIQGTLFYHH
jgi:hypothetical protein